MKTFALCCASFRRSVRRAAGVEPLLAPPVSLETFDPQQMAGHDLLYFKLHGLPDQPYWYGDRWATAVSAEQLQTAPITDAIVFVANCHLAHESPMLKALFAAGAQTVVGGDGANYAGRTRIFGADLLGMMFRIFLKFGFTPAAAFALAMGRLKVSKQDRVTRDTLAFRLYKPEWESMV